MNRPFLISQLIIDWAEKHYRTRTFNQDERVPTRPGLLYLVQKGFIRLGGNSDTNPNSQKSSSQSSKESRDSDFLLLANNNEDTQDFPRDISSFPQSEVKKHKGKSAKKMGLPKSTEDSNSDNGSSKKYPPKALSKSTDPEEETFLGFVGPGEPFELMGHSPFTFKAYAHTEETTVIWMYWEDLDNWPLFREEVLDAFRYQNQRKLLWLSTLAQPRSIDRLFGLLRLLVEEYGEPWVSQKSPDVLRGYRLPLSLSQIQIGSLIASSRVTVIRTIGLLRQQGLIYILDDNSFCLPVEQELD